MPAYSLSLTRQQSAVQVQGLEVDEVAESFRDPTSQAEVVGKVEVLQAVQVAQALGHLSLRESCVTWKRGLGRTSTQAREGGGFVSAKNKTPDSKARNHSMTTRSSSRLPG